LGVGSPYFTLPPPLPPPPHLQGLGHQMDIFLKVYEIKAIPILPVHA
jgi:hypothetical protein